MALPLTTTLLFALFTIVGPTLMGGARGSHAMSHEYYGLSTLDSPRDEVAAQPAAPFSSIHSAGPTVVGPPTNLIPVIGGGLVNNGNGNGNGGNCNPSALVQRIRPFCGMYLAPSPVPVVRPSLACCRTLSTVNLTCFCDDVVFGNGLPNVDQSKASDVYQACTFANPNFPVCVNSVLRKP